MRTAYIHKYVLSLIIGLGFLINGSAQNVKDSLLKDHFTASLNYQSNLHYYGRVDSLKSSGVFPTLGFRSKYGPYLNSSFIFLQNPSTTLGYTGTILEGGYYFPYSRNFSGNIYYDHFLFKGNSGLEQAAVSGQSGINMAYNNEIVNINGGGNIKFSKSGTDYGASAGVDKLVLFRKIFNKIVVAIDPNATINFGTHSYFQNVPKNNGLPVFPSPGTTLQEGKQFAILSYDISMPVVFVRGKFNAFISPAYVIPQHLVFVANRPDLSEKGDNLFYFAAGAGLRL